MAAHWNQRLRRPTVCLLGCLLAQLSFSAWSTHSCVFAGPSRQSRLAAHRSLLPVQAKSPDLDDLFSEPDVMPNGLKGNAEAVAAVIQQVDPKQATQAAKKVSVIDSFGSAALANLKTTFPSLEPQLSTVEPTQLVLVLVVAAVALLTILLNANSSSNTDDSTIKPKAAGNTTTNESRGTPSVSSEQSVPPVSATSIPAQPAVGAEAVAGAGAGAVAGAGAGAVAAPIRTETPVAAPEPETGVIEMTDRNAVKSASFIAFLVGYAQGGIWLGVALFIAASWVGTRRTDDFATVVKGLGRNGLKVLNFGGYLEGKYLLTEQLGSGIANASASVKEEYKQASVVIDPAASVVGVVLERQDAITDSVDSFTTAATGAACVAGDVAVQVLDKTTDALAGLGQDSNKKSSQDSVASTGA